MTDLLQQAVALHQAGDLAGAEKLYRNVLAAQPNQPDASALLGLVRGALGAHDDAIALVEKAVARDPKSALFKFHLGTVLMNARRLPQAVVAFRQATALQPSLVQGWYNLANALRAAGDWGEAIAGYRQAIKLNPAYAEAYNNLALSLVHEKQFDEALRQAKKAVEIEPRYGEGWRTLCNIAEQVKDYPLALAAGERCVALMPDSHFSWFGYGVALNRIGRDEDAIEAYKRALALKPERADIWDNLAQTYQSLNRLEEAEATFRKTIEVAGQVIPNEAERLAAGEDIPEEEYGNRHWHLALMELLRGKYKEGFARYRSRFKDVGGLKRPPYSRPLWKGEDLTGKTILVCDEQGFGDTLMFCRYVPFLRQKGARVLLSLHPALEPYFKHWPEQDGIVLHGGVIPAYDYYTSVFDLPYRFGTVRETIPANVPYLPLLPPDEETRLPDNGRLKVGVVWGGSPLHLNDGKRSIPLAEFAGIFAEPDIDFYGLNRDMKPGDSDLLPRYPVADLVPKLKNFAASARIINQLDLVITCDTATAHLAGGMGKKVWVLLPFAPDWRWLSERADSPWYPSLRLYRQPKAGDWRSVIAQVRDDLKKI